MLFSNDCLRAISFSSPDGLSERPIWLSRHVPYSTSNWTTFCPWCIWRVLFNYKSFMAWMVRWFCIFNWKVCVRGHFNLQNFLDENEEKSEWIANFGAEFEIETSEIGCKVLNFDHNLATDYPRNWIYEQVC